MIACGHCYEFAYKEAIQWLTKPPYEAPPKMTIVHGTVIDPWDGHSIKHAWVERGNKAYDWQTIVARGGKPITIRRFYEIWRPFDMTEYTPREVMQNSIRTGHYGPW